MINTVKEMKKLPTTEAVLDSVDSIKKSQTRESLNDYLGLDNTYDAYEQLERIAYKLALKKAKTPDELEMCATAIEENYCGAPYAEEWADQIRIQAYGIEWYLEKEMKSPAFKESMLFFNTYFAEEVIS